MQALRQPLNKAGYANLIDHLCLLTGTCRANERTGFGIAIDDRQGALENSGVAAKHDRQLTILRTGLAARQRRIEKINAAFRGSITDFAGDFRGGSRVINDNRTGLATLQSAIAAQQHTTNIIVVADTREHDFGAGRSRRWRCFGNSRIPGKPRLRFFRTAIVYADIVASFCQISRHREAHHTKAQERDFHQFISCRVDRRRLRFRPAHRNACSRLRLRLASRQSSTFSCADQGPWNAR